jgi:hypothetical protein
MQHSNDDTAVPGESFTAEVRRAGREIGRVLDQLYAEQALPECVADIRGLLTHADIYATSEAGEPAFEYDPDGPRITFRGSTIKKIVRDTTGLAAEVSEGDGLASQRLVQVAVNLFVLHELLHISQNFPDFATVPTIKSGLGPTGLPMLDVAADTVAAWICAQIEFRAANERTHDDLLRHYVNCLILAYQIGAFVFQVADRPEKQQRALGLIMAAVLVQAKLEGVLDEEAIHPVWEPMCPLYAFDLEKAQSFNALVIDRLPGLLMAKPMQVTKSLLDRIWSSIGVDPLETTLELVAEAFIAAGVIEAGASALEMDANNRAC